MLKTKIQSKLDQQLVAERKPIHELCSASADRETKKRRRPVRIAKKEQNRFLVLRLATERTRGIPWQSENLEAGEPKTKPVAVRRINPSIFNLTLT
jgi:hypothetical protein